MSHVVPVAANVKTLMYMKLRARLEFSPANSSLCNSMHAWGHPVASLPSGEGDNTSLLKFCRARAAAGRASHISLHTKLSTLCVVLGWTDTWSATRL
eukprot:1124446-Pleurochrysis_carterae.AAC.6